ncbi:MAG TPA: plasmid mobilization relaxosome protein MobC [Daejeonella sp.]
MTRPHKGSDEKRDRIFKVRFSAAEKKLLMALAEKAGLTPSDFVRVRTIGGTPLIKKATPERQALIKLYAELNKVGSNANQIARALNRRTDSDSLTGVSTELIRDALQSIKTLTTQIAKELGHGNPGE